jgi:WD40 repeat protein
MLQNFSGHTGEVTSVKFNPNGTYLCTSSLDGTARVWDIEQGKCLYQLKDHEGEVISI